MAAFMYRGYGRIGMSTDLLVATHPGDGSSVKVADLVIRVPEVAGEQFVSVEGAINVQTDITGILCLGDCLIDLAVKDVSGAAFGANSSYDLRTGISRDHLRTHWVFPATSGLHTYELWMDAETAEAFTLSGVSLIAQTFPFAADGGTDLDP
jgi:hypothetical protein